MESCSKYYPFVNHSLFLVWTFLGSLTLFCFGLWGLARTPKFDSLAGMGQTLLGLFGTCLIGFIGAYSLLTKNNHRSSLSSKVWYSIVAVLVVLQFGASGVGYFLHERIGDDIEAGWDRVFLQRDSSALSEANTAQEMFECCGEEQASDWINAGLLIPGSCCGRTREINCSISESFSDGCARSLNNWVDLNLGTQTTFVCVLAFVNMVFCIISFLMSTKVQENMEATAPKKWLILGIASAAGLVLFVVLVTLLSLLVPCSGSICPTRGLTQG